MPSVALSDDLDLTGVCKQIKFMKVNISDFCYSYFDLLAVLVYLSTDV